MVQIGGDAATRGNGFAVNIILQNADRNFSRTQNLLIDDTPYTSRNSMGDISIQRPWPEVNGLMVPKQDALGRYAVAQFMATDLASRHLTADINRDGKPDLLLVGDGRIVNDGRDRCGMVAVLSSAGGARLQSSTSLPCQGGGYEVVVGSLESPGQIDLVLLEPSYTVPAMPFLPRLHFYRLNEQGQPAPNTRLKAAAEPICASFQTVRA